MPISPKTIAYGICGLLLVAVVGWFVYASETIARQQDSIATLEKDRDDETRRADQNALAFTEYTAAIEANETLARDVAALRATIRADVRTIMEGINNAPPEADAPLSPVMLDALDGLRRLYDNEIATTGGNPNGVDADPDRVADVRSGDTAAGDDDTGAARGLADAGSGKRVVVQARSKPAGGGALSAGERPRDAAIPGDDEHRSAPVTLNAV